MAGRQSSAEAREPAARRRVPRPEVVDRVDVDQAGGQVVELRPPAEEEGGA
jgi:hypothetical protein